MFSDIVLEVSTWHVRCIVEVLDLGLHTNSKVALFAMIFIIFSLSKSVQETLLIVLLLFCLQLQKVQL